MSSQGSFPQFPRLPVELQIQILGYHRDTSPRRHHMFTSSEVRDVLHLPNKTSLYYDCLDLFGGQVIRNHASEVGPDVVTFIYENDGLASDKISIRTTSRSSDVITSSSKIWVNFAADVFTFRCCCLTTGLRHRPETFLGPLTLSPVTQDHWFWRIQKLALDINQTALMCGYALSDFDKAMLARTRALKTVYIVASPGLPCSCVAAHPETLVDGFVAQEDFFYANKPAADCKDASKSYSSHWGHRVATRLKGELDGIFRGRESGCRRVEVLVVFMSNLQYSHSWWPLLPRLS